MKKRKIQEGDYVYLKRGKGRQIVAQVDVISADAAVVVKTDREGDWTGKRISAKIEELEYIPPYSLSIEEMRKFARYEIGFAEVCEKAVPMINCKCCAKYKVTLDDIENVLRRVKKQLPDLEAFIEEWLRPMEAYFCDDIYFYDPEVIYLEQKPADRAPSSESDMVSEIYDWMYDLYDPEMDDEEKEKKYEAFTRTIDKVIKDIAAFRKGKRVRPWLWSEDGIKGILYFTEDSYIENYNDEMLEDCRNAIKTLCRKNDADALERYGYSCYGGNKLFACDWITARNTFLKLLTHEDVDDLEKCYYANTLGYIYYYGRCNNGVPQYEEALKYYSIGAAGGIYESVYKLADMYLNGYGTPVNKNAASCLVKLFYEENLKKIENEDFSCKFADIALRKGNLCRDGINRGDEYYYYTLADFAVRKRLKYDHYGDKKVFMGIQNELARIREKKPLKKISSISFDEPLYIDHALEKNPCQISFKEMKQGLVISAERLVKPHKTRIRKFFICIPDAGYCELTGNVAMTAVKVTKYHVKGNKKEFIADEIYVDQKPGGKTREVYFRHHRMIVATVTAESFRYKLKKKEVKSKKYRFASVRFSPEGKTYDYLAGNAKLKVGDKVYVTANGEKKQVEVVRIFTADIADMPIDIENYKTIEQ